MQRGSVGLEEAERLRNRLHIYAEDVFKCVLLARIRGTLYSWSRFHFGPVAGYRPIYYKTPTWVKACEGIFEYSLSLLVGFVRRVDNVQPVKHDVGYHLSFTRE